MDSIILRELGRDVERFWEDIRELYRGGATPEDIRLVTGGQDNMPSVDVYRSADHFTLMTELPGLTEKDINIEVKDGMLSISGKYPDRDREGETLVRREGLEGEFCRSFELPDDVDADQIVASFKNGVLELRLPRTGKTPEKHVKVEVH